MQIIIKWQDKSMTAPNWFDFPVSDIDFMPVSHAVALFSRNIPVIVKEDEQYLVNTAALLKSYKDKGSKVMLLTSVDNDRMNLRLGTVGFVTPIDSATLKRISA